VIDPGPSTGYLTVLYVACDQNRLLMESIARLPVGQPILILDVGMVDDARELVGSCNATVIRCRWRPIAEQVLRENWECLPEGWMLRLDPDESVSGASVGTLEHLALASNSRVAAFRVPLVNLYRDRPLVGTVWGGVHLHPRVFRRDSVSYTGIVHDPPTVLGDTLDAPSDCVITHRWVISRVDMVEKHFRYIRLEREARRDAQEYSTARACATVGVRAFGMSFVHRRGFRDGWRGLGLSLFYAGYEFLSNYVPPGDTLPD